MLRAIKSFLFFALKNTLGNKITKALHRRYKRRFSVIQKSDLKMIEKLSKHIDYGGVVFDIGANIGDWTICLSKIVGQSGKVVSFEPNQETASILKQRTRRVSNVEVLTLGLSDREEQLELLIPKEISCPPNAAIAQTANHLNKENLMESVLVQVEKLDQVMIDRNIQNVNFVKIDVEGHELNVLKGFYNGLKQIKPIIFIEILKSKWIGDSPLHSECAVFLKKLGYEMFQYNSQAKKFESLENFNRTDFNFLFLPILNA